MKYRSEFQHGFTYPEAVAWKYSVKKVLLKISQISQETPAPESPSPFFWYKCSL